MEEEGIVIGIPRPGLALVRMAGSSACRGCSARGLCHGGEGSSGRVVEAVDPVGVAEGQQVVLSLAAGEALKGSRAPYLIPLLVFLVIGGLVQTAGPGLTGPRDLPLAGALAGLAGMAVAFFLIRRARRRREVEALRPTIARLAEPAP